MSLPSFLHATRWYGLLAFVYLRAFWPRGDAFAYGMAAVCLMNMLFVQAVVFFLVIPSLLSHVLRSPVLPLITATVMALKVAIFTIVLYGTWRIFLAGPPLRDWLKIYRYNRQEMHLQNPCLLPSSQFDKFFREAANDPAKHFLIPRFFRSALPPGSTITPKDLSPLFVSPDKSIRILAMQLSPRLARPKSASLTGKVERSETVLGTEGSLVEGALATSS